MGEGHEGRTVLPKCCSSFEKLFPMLQTDSLEISVSFNVRSKKMVVDGCIQEKQVQKNQVCVYMDGCAQAREWVECVKRELRLPPD